MIPGIDILVGMILLLIPGFLVIQFLKLQSFSEQLGFTLLFSMILVGNVTYLLSFFVPVNAWMLVSTSLIGLVLVWKKNKGVGKIHPPKWDPITAIWIILLGVFFLIVAVHLFSFPSNVYDSLSYHTPFIESFRDQGQLLPFDHPLNGYEVRANYYPKFFEALMGIIAQVSPAVSSVIPIVVGMTSLVLLFSLSRRVGKANMYAPMLYGSIGMVLFELMTNLNDGMTALLTIGSAFLMILLIQQPEQRGRITFLFGMAAASIVTTKLVGLIPFIALLIGWFIFVQQKKWLPLLGGALAGGGYYFLFLVVKPLPSVMQLGGGKIVGERTITGMIANAAYVLGNIGKMQYGIILLAPAFIFGTIFLLWKWKSISNEQRALIVVTLAFGMGVFTYGFTGIHPSIEGLYRYAFGFFALASVMAGIFLVKIENALAKWSIGSIPVSRILGTLLVGALILVSLAFVSLYTQARSNHSTFYDQMEAAWKDIPNGSAIYFANTINPAIQGFDESRVRDWISFPDAPSSNACDFLRKKGIEYLIIISPQRPIPDMGAFNQALCQESQQSECGTRIGHSGEWLNVYQLNAD